MNHKIARLQKMRRLRRDRLYPFMRDEDGKIVVWHGVKIRDYSRLLFRRSALELFLRGEWTPPRTTVWIHGL